jgi:hypothetical protein
MGKDNEMSLHFASISGKKVEADFDGGRLTSNGGVVDLRAVDKSIGLIERLCDCISDDRHQSYVVTNLTSSRPSFIYEKVYIQFPGPFPLKHLYQGLCGPFS